VKTIKEHSFSTREGRVVEKRAREKTDERGENKQFTALSPLSKRLSPQDDGKTLLRRWSTQTIRKRKKEKGHKSKTAKHVLSTQSIKTTQGKTVTS